MKYVDDYKAKLAIWASGGKVCRMPTIANLPHFGHRKFRSHVEMNVWKKELLGQLAERGGATWKTVKTAKFYFPGLTLTVP